MSFGIQGSMHHVNSMALGRRGVGKMAMVLAFAGILFVAALVILELGSMTLASVPQPTPLALPNNDPSTTVTAIIINQNVPQTLDEQTAALANALAPSAGSRTLEQQTAALMTLIASRQAAKAREGAPPAKTPSLLQPRQKDPTLYEQQTSSAQISNGSFAFSTHHRLKSMTSSYAILIDRGDADARVALIKNRQHANAAYNPIADYNDSSSRVLIFIMTSALISRKRYNNKNLFEERAIPAMRTWAAAFPRTWFVMDAGPAATGALENCDFASVAEVTHRATSHNNEGVIHAATSSPPRKKFKPTNWTVADCSHAATTTGSDHPVSRPVLLTGCNNGYWGAGGPCCKCEAALRFAAGLLLHVKNDLENSSRHRRHLSSNSRSIRDLRGFGLTGSGAPIGASVAPFDWILYSDDDMYYAPKPFLAFLRRHDPNVAQVLGPGGPLAPFVVYPARTGCTLPGARGVTLQPAVLSVAGLSRASEGLRASGITAQCEAFNSTHDAGLAVFLWMLGNVALQRDLGQVLTGLEAWKRAGSGDASRCLVHRVKFKKDFELVHEAFKGPYSGLGSSSSGGGSNASTSVSLEAAAVVWLASLKPSPPPMQQLGYLDSQHHAREKAHRTGALLALRKEASEVSGGKEVFRRPTMNGQGKGQEGVQVRDSGEWPTLTAGDCIRKGA